MTTSPTTRPSKANTAIILLYVAWALGVLRAFLGAPAISHLGSVGQTEAAVAIVVVIFAIMLFFIFMIGKGRNWARITVLVLYIIGTAMMIVGLVSGAPFGAAAIMDVVQVIVQLVALVMLFSPESNAWFQGVKGGQGQKLARSGWPQGQDQGRSGRLRPGGRSRTRSRHAPPRFSGR